MSGFAELRAILIKDPSKEHWERLLGLFLNWPTSDERDAAVMYARSHLSGWPPWLRCFSSIAPHHPAWPLAQSVTLKEAECRHWRRLKSYPQITHLTLEAPLSRRDIEGLEELETLRGLCLKRCVWLEDTQRLAGLAHLETLLLQGCTQVREVSGIASLRNLRALEVTEAPQLLDAAALAALPLERLSLRGNLALSTIRPLEALPTLHTLDIGSCVQLETQDLGVLSKLPHLRSLALCDLPALKRLPSLPALSSLDISFCGALESLEGLEPSASLTQIQAVGATLLKDIHALAGHRYLERLDLSRCLALKHVAALASLPALCDLNLRIGKGKISYADPLPHLQPKPYIAWMEVRGMVEPYQQRIAQHWGRCS